MRYWSQPYPDEILYSIVARHIDYFGVKGPKQLLLGLFGRDTVSSTLDLPSGLSNLARSFKGNSLKASDLICKHTLFPYYSKFISERRRSEIMSSMLDRSGDIHTRCGINAGLFSSLKAPRYCSECSKEDLGNYGEVYFRRAHQIPSLRICVVHNIYLNEVKLDGVSINKHFFIKPSALLSGNSLSLTKPNHNIPTLEIGEKAASLLTKHCEIDFDGTSLFYNELIKKIGFRKGTKSLQIERIYRSFQGYYDDEMLKHYKSSVDFEDPNCWLKSIFRKHRKSFDPVRHILILNFIDHLKSENESKHETKSKTKIHVCRNPVCKQYGSDNKTNHSIKTDAKSKRDIIHIACECGYSYTKSFIKNSWFIRVKDFGELWELELQKLIKKGHSIRSVAAKLHADSKTIKNYFNREEKRDQTIYLKDRQNEWALLRNKFPKHSITELREKGPSKYSFLYREAKDWLLSQDYPIKQRVIIHRVDWNERDSQLLKEIQKAYLEFKLGFPRRRRSRTAILNLIGRESMVRSNSKKLPKLSAFLTKNSESPQRYRLRRLAMATIDLRQSKESFSYWSLFRAAGIRKEYIDDSLHAIALKVLDGSIDERILFSKYA